MSKRVIDIARRQVVTAWPDEPLDAAAERMRRLGVRHLPVVAPIAPAPGVATEPPQALGMLSDRDIRLAIGDTRPWQRPPDAPGAPAPHAPAGAMTVGMVMTRPIIGLPPTASLPEAAQAMVREKIGSLAVLEGGRLIGLLTETDLLAALVEMLDSTEPSPEVPEALRRAAGIALDAMSFPLVTVPPTATLAEALSLMGGRDIRHLPVTEGGRLVGVLSDRDIRTAMGREAVTAGVFAGHPPAGGRPVSELMNPPLHVLSAPATLADAARTMLLHRISALPVVAADDPSRPVGILTETDLLVALVGMTG